MSSLARSWRPNVLLRLLLLYAIGILVALIFLLPIFWLVSSSLKTRLMILSETGINLIPPIPWQWQNYRDAWTVMPFTIYLRNTIVIAVASLAGTLLTGSMVAYGFGRLRFPGRNILFAVLLSTLMLPSQVTIIPTFLLFHRLGWVNTFWPLIVPSWVGGGAFYVFLMRQYMTTIPLELDDAAKVDGCSPIGIYRHIILPNLGPALATASIFTFVGHWNELFGALIYLIDEQLWTLPRAMLTFRQSFADPQGIYKEYHLEWLAAMAVLTMLPPLLFFLAFQRYFVRGAVLTGIKG